MASISALVAPCPVQRLVPKAAVPGCAGQTWDKVLFASLRQALRPTGSPKAPCDTSGRSLMSPARSVIFQSGREALSAETFCLVFGMCAMLFAALPSSQLSEHQRPSAPVQCNFLGVAVPVQRGCWVQDRDMVSKACFALASMSPWVPDLVLPLVHSRFLASLRPARVLPGPLSCAQAACPSCELPLTCSGLCRRSPWRLSRPRTS